MKTLLLLLCLVTLAQAHTRWPDPYVAGYKYGQTDASFYAQNYAGNLEDRELTRYARDFAVSLECPVRMRAQFVKGFKSGFREGCRLNGIF